MKLKLINAFHWRIQYVIYGYPPPNVTWLKDGSPLVQNDVIYDRVTSRGEAVTRGGLLFEMSNHLNNGNYTLIASNLYGNSSQTISAIFLQPPGLQLFRIVISASLSINKASVSANEVDLWPVPSVCVCVCVGLSICRSARKYIVAKRLIGS